MKIVRIRDGAEYSVEKVITLEEQVPSIQVNKGFPLRCAVVSQEGKKYFLKFVLKKECSLPAYKAAELAYARELKFQMRHPGVAYVESVDDYELKIIEENGEDGTYEGNEKAFLETILRVMGADSSVALLGLLEEYAGSRNLIDVYHEEEERLPDEILFLHIYRLLDGMCGYYGRFPKDPLLHRDIKPANIVIGEDIRQIKYIDFDFAHVTGSKATKMRGGFGMGTVGYAHPRQTQAEIGSSDIRIDFYGLGMTILYMLCGQDYLLKCGLTEAELDSWSYISNPAYYPLLYKVKRDKLIRNGDSVYQGKRYEGLLDIVDLMIADDTESDKNRIRDPRILLEKYESYLFRLYGRKSRSLFCDECMLSRFTGAASGYGIVQLYSYKKGAKILKLHENSMIELVDDLGNKMGLLYLVGGKVEALIPELKETLKENLFEIGEDPLNFEIKQHKYRLLLISRDGLE